MQLSLKEMVWPSCRTWRRWGEGGRVLWGEAEQLAVIQSQPEQQMLTEKCSGGKGDRALHPQDSEPAPNASAPHCGTPGTHSQRGAHRFVPFHVLALTSTMGPGWLAGKGESRIIDTMDAAYNGWSAPGESMTRPV